MKTPGKHRHSPFFFLAAALLLTTSGGGAFGPVARADEPEEIGEIEDGDEAPPEVEIVEDAPVEDEQEVSAARCRHAHDIGFTIKSGDYIKGSASWTVCENNVYVFTSLQRLRAFNIWWPVKEVRVRPRSHTSGAHTVQWRCRGAGTYTYKTVTRMYKVAPDGRFHEMSVKVSNQRRVSC